MHVVEMRTSRVFPSGQTMTTVGEEKKLNKRLTKDLPAFIQIMKDLKLPYPKKIGKDLVPPMRCVL